MNTYLVTTDTEQVSLIAKDVEQAKEFYINLHGEYEWIEVINYQNLYI